MSAYWPGSGNFVPDSNRFGWILTKTVGFWLEWLASDTNGQIPAIFAKI
jgi:hypothetical protein